MPEILDRRVRAVITQTIEKSFLSVNTRTVVCVCDIAVKFVCSTCIRSQDRVHVADVSCLSKMCITERPKFRGRIVAAMIVVIMRDPKADLYTREDHPSPDLLAGIILTKSRNNERESCCKQRTFSIVTNG